MTLTRELCEELFQLGLKPPENPVGEWFWCRVTNEQKLMLCTFGKLGSAYPVSTGVLITDTKHKCRLLIPGEEQTYWRHIDDCLYAPDLEAVMGWLDKRTAENQGPLWVQKNDYEWEAGYQCIVYEADNPLLAAARLAIKIGGEQA
jgi:hypothetical protein